jgi:hypothetical protein
MARRVKINSNPNSTPYDDNPYKQIGKNWRWNPDTGGEIDDTKPPKRTIKVDSNPVPGKTRIGNLARPGRGGGAGGAFTENLK